MPFAGPVPKLLRQVNAGLEASPLIDKVAGPVNRFVVKNLKGGDLKDALSGTWLGHPVHPGLVAIPIGSWLGASVLDLTPGDKAAGARRLVGLGLLAATPTVLSGLSDWSDTDGAEQRVGAVHAGLNLAAIAVYGASWLRRRRGGHAGAGLALVGAGLTVAAGYLGGHLAYALGVGVDANAFHTGPSDWQAVVSVSDLEEGRPRAVSAAGVSLMVVKVAGQVHVLDNRCSHRGAPLAEGQVADGCVTCPWHSSVFELGSGEVRRGPATQAQPVYQTREVGGRIEVRRAEPRGLRSNAVGSA